MEKRDRENGKDRAVQTAAMNHFMTMRIHLMANPFTDHDEQTKIVMTVVQELLFFYSS